MTAPYGWIAKVEEALAESKQLPAWEEAFSFPWEEAGLALAKALSLPELKISLKTSSWKKEREFFEGMGKDPLITSMQLSPIKELIFWVFPSEDTSFFSSLLLSSEGFSDPRLQQGFYQFLFLEAVSAIDKLKLFKNVTFHLMEESTLPKERAFCLDISLHLSHKTLHGRLICSQAFLEGFKTQGALQRAALLETDVAKKLDILLHLNIGQTTLSAEEWKSISPGDFIVLDRCSYDPKTEKGSISVLLGNSPLFRARIKEEGIKILDYAFYHEEENMSENESDDSEEIELGEEGAPSMEKMISPGQVPITLTVEVGRLSMNLDKLLQLKAGSILDIAVKPEQGVDVTVGGKKVAKAELIKLGETLGIKILHVE